MSEPDPRFLAGEKAVLTNAADMALVMCIGWDGAADVQANVDKKEAARMLRFLADHWDPIPEDNT